MRRILMSFFLLMCIGVLIGCVSQRPLYTKEGKKVYRNLKQAIKNKESVEILVLYGRELEEFPLEIMQLENLIHLDLSNNKIKEVPPEINRLRRLEKLSLMKNSLQELPTEMAQLKNLKWLNVAYNHIIDEDVFFLRDSLPKCQVITYIEL